MYKNGRQSVQLYKCTDINTRFNRNETTFNNLFKKEKKKYDAEIVKYRIKYFTWFINRTLSTLWKERLQMYERKRTWSEILFICKLSKTKAGNALHSHKTKRKSKIMLGQFQKDSTNIGRHQHNKQRVTSAKKGIITKAYGYNKIRNNGNSANRCQYAHEIFTKKIFKNFIKGYAL